MNREQRRRVKKERREPYRPGVPLLKEGQRLFWKAIRRLNLVDIVKLAKTFDRDSLAKHNKRIATHDELNDKDAIISEVVAMLDSKPGDDDYPIISNKNKRLKAWLRIKPEKGYYYYYRNLFYITRTLAKAGYQELWDMTNYLFSNHIARRYGLNKGRQRKQNKGEAQVHFVNREVELTADDVATTADIDQIETQDMYQRTLAVYNKVMIPVDQLLIRARLLDANNFEVGYHKHQRELAKYGITTTQGARKRLETITKRYPELEEIRKALKR